MPGFGGQSGPQASNVDKYTEMPAPMDMPGPMPSAQLLPYAQLGNSLMGMLGSEPGASLLGGFSPFLPDKAPPVASPGGPLPQPVPSQMPTAMGPQKTFRHDWQKYGGR